MSTKVNLCHRIDIKVAAGKNLEPKTKYCVLYNVLDNENAQCVMDAKSNVQFGQQLNTTPIVAADRKGFVLWNHKNYLTWPSQSRTVLKIQCFHSKKAGIFKTAVGEIVVPLNTLPSGVQKKRWVKMKVKGAKLAQSLMLSVRYLDEFASEYMESTAKLIADEDKLLSLLADGNDSIPANLMISFSTKTTALHSACFNNHTRLGLELLRRGADCNAVDSKGRTPTMLACKQSNEELVFEMLDSGAVDLTIRDDVKQSLLHYACKGQSTEIVRRFLELGWDPAEMAGGTKTPLHYAAHSGSDEQVQILLDKGVPVDVQSENSQTPLILAVKKQHLSTTRLLLENKANPDLDSHFVPPAVIAVNNGDVDTLKLLLELSQKEKIARFHVPCIHTAAKKGFLDVLQILVPLRAKALQGLHNNMSCVHAAVLGKQSEVLRYLSSMGADPNMVCEEWNGMEEVTPLAMAVSTGNLKLVRALLKHFPTIDINATCSWDLYESSNLTAVHIAILVEALDVLKLLLDQPDILVSLETKTKSANHVKNGLTPKNLAFSKGMSEYLKEIKRTRLLSPRSANSPKTTKRRRKSARNFTAVLGRSATDIIPSSKKRSSKNYSANDLKPPEKESRRSSANNISSAKSSQANKQ